MENFQRNFSTGEVEVESPTPALPSREGAATVIYHKTEYKERRNHYAYYSVNTAAQGFDTDRESFVGLYNGFDAPECVMAGRPKNSIAHGWSPIASHYIEVELQPGESKDYIFVLGYVENEQEEKYERAEGAVQSSNAPAARSTVQTSLGALDHTIINKRKAHETIARFDTVEKVDKAFAELNRYWDDLLNIYKVTTGNAKLDRMSISAW